MSWRVRFLDNEVENFFQTTLYVNESKYYVGQKFTYDKETRGKCWDDCLKFAANFEKDIMILLSEQAGNTNDKGSIKE
tara:strand:+ start:356 stop:589 length:234 start_codon:yes stop_codon:yes gene_type:complete